MKIFSPMATGNGAYIVHKMLAERINGYQLCGYNPYWTLCPPVLPFLCKPGNADVIHSTPDYAWFFKHSKTPLIVTFHNYVLDHFMMQYSSFAQRIHYKTDLRYFTLKALDAARVVTAVSQFTADLVRKETGYSDEIKVIYNGVDTNLFRPAKKNRGKTVKVLFCGNLTKRKGANLLPQLAEKLEGGIEILYTTGLRTKGAIPGGHKLRNIGAVAYGDMAKVYQDVDMLFSPSVREGFGLAVAEAMATGLPVVASECSSLPELIDSGRGGFLCQVGDVEEFSNKINKLAASFGLCREMGQYNRERVEQKFTLERMVREYSELFEHMVGEKQEIRHG
ncbi:glycosyltransferase family 4 protein [Thiovibrio sp. JS02]